ncbi:helix-turn-helix domain-containing protein [Chryseobacterium fluminis]|uniref:helix-turn-helix transcriptional regulator n=1 Tax=Chryseobacterium fluminis TaxID=2983606 RepID=UPI002258CEF0|nr:helix-turn-helix domain-containing protein [Chryseobacterium sp. MMS21-Ot14]UZT97953.1 helix-turn-helix domain-containing protein [Chryseobacterium sp. MMS21-Ot14]
MIDEYLKEIHIGSLIKQAALEKEIDLDRICNFINCTETEIYQVYESEDLSAKVLLKWSKLLEYDFFRLYTQHLLLYSSFPRNNGQSGTSKSKLPQFRKNMYSNEIVMFILELIQNKEMTIPEITEKYNISRTTIYKWIAKNKKL